MKRWSLVICHLSFVLCLTAAEAEPRPTAQGPLTRDDVQDFIFLGESRPVLVRLQVRLDGKPLQAAWDDLMKFVFLHLDVNGDGVLGKEEAERAPSIDQIIGGGLPGRGGRGGAVRTPAPAFDALDVDKDGQVTPAELSAWYRANGCAPFQFQLSAPANRLGGAAAFLGAGRAEPAAAAVSEAIFKLLDTDSSGKLTKDRLEAAPAVLLRLDEDEDEMVTARELVPNAAPPNPLGAMMAMGSAAAPSTSITLAAIPAPGEAPPAVLKAMLERYGSKSAKPEEKKLSRKDLGLDEATFAKLDVNGDGLLDAAELAGFVKRLPDLEFSIRLGQQDTKGEPVSIRPESPLAGKVRLKDGLAQLDMGVTRMDLRGSEFERGNPFGDLLRQQFRAQFRQVDTTDKGYLDEKEARGNRLLGGLFKAMDRDGDGKLTEKELLAHLDHLQELQKRSAAGCVTLVLSNQSRGLFDLLDVNRDGRLGVRELRGAVNLLPELDRDGKGHLVAADIPRLYQLTLRRGPAENGALSEASAFFDLYRAAARDQVDLPGRGPLWFRKMDRNRDGDVSRKEFLFGAEAFRRLDADGDGLISPEEAERSDTANP